MTTILIARQLLLMPRRSARQVRGASRCWLWFALLAGLAYGFTSTASAADAAPFLWQVHGSKATHFLLGSVHLQPRGGSGLPAPIGAAVRLRQEVVFESDIGVLHSRSTQQAFAQRGRAADGGMQREVGDELFQQTQARLRDMSLPTTMCNQLRAWLCATSIGLLQWRREGFDGAEGIDEYVYRAAQHDHRKVSWFEAPSEQISLFADMPDPVVRDFLRSSLEDQDDPLDSPSAIYKAWKNNDVAYIERMVGELHQQYPSVYERLLAARNRKWMPSLLQRMESNNSQLIVVGAAHLVGPDGLVAALKAKGYVVVPVTSLGPQEVAMTPEVQAGLQDR